MSSRPFIIPQDFEGFKGYRSDAANSPPDYICRPSVNCMININGDAETRFGYLDTGWDLGLGENAVRPFYHETYDITVFIGGGKVQYVDHNTNDTVIDTGSTVTANTTTRIDEYNGDIYYTNTTDGLKRGVFGKINDSNANQGDSDVTVDLDMALRLSSFGKTTGNIILAGDSYAFNAVDTSTGKITLNAVTLSKDYDDNTVVFVEHDISSGREKGSKVTFWQERMMIMGSIDTTNADQPQNTVFTGKFCVGHSSATSIEDIIDFTYGSGGSTRITVGKGGKLTNIIGGKDSMYFLKKKELYDVYKGDISKDSADTTSTIGLTIPQLKDENHGCINEDSAISIGNNELAYITNDKRIMRIKLASQAGVPAYPDEAFDNDIWLDLENMDEDQPLAMAFHYRAQRKSIFQIALDGQWYWMIYDHLIGAWQPPQLVVPVGGFFERRGVLYATDCTNDTVYSIFTAFDDNGIPIDCTIATPEFNVDDSMVKRGEMKGIITQGTKMEIRSYVFNNKGGMRISSPKKVDGSDYTYGKDRTIGAVPIGGSGSGLREQFADWKKDFDIFPQECNKIQLRATCEGDHFSIQRLQLKGELYSSAFQKAL